MKLVATARSISQAMFDHFNIQFERHYQRMVNNYEFKLEQLNKQWEEKMQELETKIKRLD